MSRYLEGVSLTALARGNRRMLAPLKARHADAKDQHAETLKAWKERRAKAREIKDPEQRAAALEALKGERPAHPMLVAAGCTVVAGVVLWPMVHSHAAVVASGGLTLWLIVALVLGQAEPTPKADPADGTAADEEQPEKTVPTPAEVHALTAPHAARGASVLLTRLAADLAASHPGWEPSTKAVRALLAEAAIPVREGVRTPDGNGPGIHHQDVPPLPSPTGAAPLPGVVANVGAGQTANANTNNTEEWSTREGFVWRIDPDHPAHTIVARPADAA